MYETYDKTCILTNSDKLIEVLRKGFKNVYHKQKVEKSHRKSKLTWVSPYNQTPESSYFLIKENTFRYFGNVKQVYFSSRYAEDRKLVRAWYDNYTSTSSSNNDTCGVIGSGIGPYSINLSKTFNSIDEYDINSNAIRYSEINKILNRTENIRSHNKTYDGKSYDHLIVIMPSKSIRHNLNYNFTKTLCVYILLNAANKTNFEKIISRKKYKILCQRTVRPYAKGVNIYRYILSKS